MKFRKIALLIVFLLVIQLMPGVSVNASDDSTDSRVIRFLTAFDIMGVDEKSGNFWDETLVKRSEMAMILCNMFRVTPTVESSPMFEDVREDERAYVETAVRNGYMSGHGSNRFEPKEFVTNEQLVKIFVCALGGDSLARRAGGYPNGYVEIAKRLGIFNSINGALSEPSTRSNVAAMIYDAMHADMLRLTSISSDGENYDIIENHTFLTEVLNIYRYEGTVTANYFTGVDDSSGLEKDMVEVEGKVYSDSEGFTDEYLGCSVIIYVDQPENAKIGEIVYAEESRKNTTVEIDTENIREVSDSEAQYVENDRKRTLKLSPVADMIYNDKSTDYDTSRLKSLRNGYVRFIDNNGDKMYDVIIIREFTTAVVYKIEAGTGRDKVFFSYGVPAITLDDSSSFGFYRDGKKTEIENVGIGEVVSVAVSDNESGKKAYRLELSSETVSGSVKIVKDEGDKTYAEINDVDYEIGDYCRKLIEQNYLGALKAGSVGTFYLDSMGKIAYFDINKSGAYVGYLIQSAVNENVFTPILSVMLFSAEKGIQSYRITDKIVVNDSKMDVSDVVNNARLMEEFGTQQLVQFDEDDDGGLKKIVFPVIGYDEQDFSLDVDASTTATKLILTSASVLDHKYYVTAGTKVFSVPGMLSDVVDTEPAHYKVYTGTYFADIGNSYATYLYDVEKNGFVRYALYKRWWNEDHVWDGSPVILVTGCGDGLDDDGEEIKVVSGLNESGKEVVLKTPVTNNTSKLKPGDVFQYTNDFKGKVHDIKIMHTVDSDLYAPINIDPAYSGYKSYGEVIRCTPNSMQISSAEDRSPNMEPTRVDRIVMNNGKAVCAFSKERQKYRIISFEEINPGDNVFVCINEENESRMIVVYE